MFSCLSFALSVFLPFRARVSVRHSHSMTLRTHIFVHLMTITTHPLSPTQNARLSFGVTKFYSASNILRITVSTLAHLHFSEISFRSLLFDSHGKRFIIFYLKKITYHEIMHSHSACIHIFIGNASVSRHTLLAYAILKVCG